jgi:uncharacterized Zn-binding protein involved in type VI secretion
MPPAARVNDPTSHGSPLTPGPGSPDVQIGGQPAWRMTTDQHVCPLSTGSVPHQGGMVAVGSKSVLINGVGAARQGDQIVEKGPPNAIAAGFPSVIIGG